jgi:hypothetical protein
LSTSRGQAEDKQELRGDQAEQVGDKQRARGEQAESSREQAESSMSKQMQSTSLAGIASREHTISTFVAFELLRAFRLKTDSWLVSPDLPLSARYMYVPSCLPNAPFHAFAPMLAVPSCAAPLALYLPPALSALLPFFEPLLLQTGLSCLVSA